MSVPYRHIEICGGIAAGKTTLAQLVTRSNISAVLEDFQSNPFWRPFYADPAGTAFETEVSFLLQHYHAIKAAKKLGRSFACDFSLYLDSAYAQVTLDGGKRNAFLAVLKEIRNELPAPDLLIQLRCDPETELDRIRRRARAVEAAITVTYLSRLNEALDTVLTDHDPKSVLIIDSAAKNFAENDNDKRSVLDEISTRLVL